MEYELHFQEVFSGENVEIIIDGVIVSSITLQTRFQTGLAHIEKLQLQPGQKVEIRIVELKINTILHLKEDFMYVIINLHNGVLLTRATDRLPGYL